MDSEGGKKREREWEKRAFWRYRDPTQFRFFKILLGKDSFNLHLSIPSKFAVNFRAKLCGTFELRGPSGNTWRVEITMLNNTLFLEHGWPNFLQDHCLQETDFLVFRYTGGSSFDVEMFDLTGCEKECSYLNNYGSSFTSSSTKFFKVLIGNTFKLHLRFPTNFMLNFNANLSETVELRGPSGNTWRAEITGTKNALFLEHGWQNFIQDHCLQETDFLVFRYTGGSSFDVEMFDLTGCQKECSYFVNSYGSSFTPRPNCEFKRKEKERDEATEKHEKKVKPKIQNTRHLRLGSVQFAADASSAHAKLGLKYKYYLISSRRPVTQAEKDKALLAAAEHAFKLSGPAFSRVMRQCHVYKDPRMEIPLKWAREYLPYGSHFVFLRVFGSSNKWICGFCVNKSTAILRKGWVRFVLENNLEEGDVCTFELSQGGKGSKVIIVIDVSIFRVVDEKVPLTKLETNS